MGQWGDAFTSLSLISREYNCFIVLFEKYKIGRKIQALSEAIILCHGLTSAFPFLLKLASGSGVLREEKKLGLSTQQKFLLGLGDEITNAGLQHTSDFSAVEGRLEDPLLLLHLEGLRTGRRKMSGLPGGLWQWVSRDEEFRERKTSR